MKFRLTSRFLKQLLNLAFATLLGLGLAFGSSWMIPGAWLSAGFGGSDFGYGGAAASAQVASQTSSPVLSQVPSQSVSRSVWRTASFPVENFQTYTSPFGYRRSATGGPSMEFHYGLDLAAPLGSYIRNWWTGQVVEVSDDSRCGTSIVIQSGTWEHIYCHMSGGVEVIRGQRYLVDRPGGIQIREGQMITTGSRIGRIGMTGRTTGPHLHWGIKNKGQWVDPGKVLRAMQSSQVS